MMVAIGSEAGLPLLKTQPDHGTRWLELLTLRLPLPGLLSRPLLEFGALLPTCPENPFPDDGKFTQ